MKTKKFKILNLTTNIILILVTIVDIITYFVSNNIIDKYSIISLGIILGLRTLLIISSFCYKYRKVMSISLIMKIIYGFLWTPILIPGIRVRNIICILEILPAIYLFVSSFYLKLKIEDEKLEERSNSNKLASHLI